jgi:hypothetical protein
MEVTMASYSGYDQEWSLSQIRKMISMNRLNKVDEDYGWNKGRGERGGRKYMNHLLGYDWLRKSKRNGRYYVNF